MALWYHLYLLCKRLRVRDSVDSTEFIQGNPNCPRDQSEALEILKWQCKKYFVCLYFNCQITGCVLYVNLNLQSGRNISSLPNVCFRMFLNLKSTKNENEMATHQSESSSVSYL